MTVSQARGESRPRAEPVLAHTSLLSPSGLSLVIGWLLLSCGSDQPGRSRWGWRHERERFSPHWGAWLLLVEPGRRVCGHRRGRSALFADGLGLTVPASRAFAESVRQKARDHRLRAERFWQEYGPRH